MKKNRAFLKWAGGKYSLIDDIRRHLPEGDTLVEPFVGAGSVFLNTDYPRYLLNDINPDLITLYKLIRQDADRYVSDARSYFVPEMNQKARYYEIRSRFNACSDPYERALLFLYLNRHGYNGLCRYNRKGGFNVPFGSYKRPYFPEAELYWFAEKAQRAEFVCESYADTFAKATNGAVVYCDPPYAPLSTTASFTTYSGNGFTLDDQALLAKVARETAEGRRIPVLISNHDIPLTRELYREAHLNVVQVKRTISRHTHTRQSVGELLALYAVNGSAPN